MNEEKPRNRTRALVAVCIIAGAVVIAILVLVLHNFVFVIKNVNVEGTLKSDSEKIAEASGVETGKPMYSINKREIADRIMKSDPYIESVSIKRALPSDLNITVSESEASCFCVVADEYFILSDGLRVLEYTDDAKYAESAASFRVVLPDVSRMILGEKVSFFSDSDHEYIKDVIDAVGASKLSERIELVSVKNKFSVYAVCDGMYRIDLGSYEDASLKFEVAFAIIDSGKLTEAVNAAIDVSDPTEAQVISDKNLILAPDVQK